jgi:hypothetical protein
LLSLRTTAATEAAVTEIKTMTTKKLITQDTVEKATLKSRVDCSALVGSKAAQSPIWQAQSAVQDSGGKLITAGTALSAAAAVSNKADSDAAAARTTVDTLTIAWDSAYGVYSANVKQYAVKSEDVSGLGLAVGERASYELAIPVAVEASYDANLGAITIHVTHAPGMTSCEIEITATPADPTSWKRIKGNGAKRTVTGYASGTYWVRAASVRAEEESDYTAPVAVIVK